MIPSTDNYTYDSTTHRFVLTEDGAKEYTKIPDLSTEFVNLEARLQQQSDLLYEIMAISKNLNIKPRYRRSDIVEYLLYKNENNEQDAIVKMLIEMCRWDYEYDIISLMYSGEKTIMDFYRMLPPIIKSQGYNSGLIWVGETNLIVPEDEYRVDY